VGGRTAVFLAGTWGFAETGGYHGTTRASRRGCARSRRTRSWSPTNPGFAWRAGLRVPDQLVDVSVKQFDQDRITEPDMLRAARARDACAVLATSDERLGPLPRTCPTGSPTTATAPSSTTATPASS
jgi:hypothetical protein